MKKKNIKIYKIDRDLWSFVTFYIYHWQQCIYKIKYFSLGESRFTGYISKFCSGIIFLMKRKTEIIILLQCFLEIRARETILNPANLSVKWTEKKNSFKIINRNGSLYDALFQSSTSNAPRFMIKLFVFIEVLF